MTSISALLCSFSSGEKINNKSIFLKGLVIYKYFTILCQIIPFFWNKKNWNMFMSKNNSLNLKIIPSYFDNNNHILRAWNNFHLQNFIQLKSFPTVSFVFKDIFHNHIFGSFTSGKIPFILVLCHFMVGYLQFVKFIWHLLSLFILLCRFMQEVNLTSHFLKIL